MPLHYLSFADDEWLGGLFIEAPDFPSAITASHVQGLNPGGEIMSVELPDDAPIPVEYRNRLLSRTDLEDLDRVMGGEGKTRKIR